MVTDIPTFVVRVAALLIVALLPLVISPFGTDAYSGPKVLILYTLGALTAAAWIAASAAGRRTAVTVPADLPAMALLFTLLVSSALSVRPRLTLFGSPGRYEGLLAYLAYLVLFFAGARFLSTAAEFRRLARTAGIVAGAAALYGVAQLGLHPLVPGEAMIREWYSSTGFVRVFSTLGSPVIFGGYLALMLPLTMGLAVNGCGPSGIGWAAVAGVCAMALVMTVTRAAWAGAGAGLMAFAWLSRGTARRPAIAGVVAAGLLIGSVLLVSAARSPEALITRMTSSAEIQSGSMGQRLYIWGQTVRLIRQRPWLGWGLETLREVFPYDRAALVRVFGRRPVIIDKAHNDVLQMGVSAGLPAAAVYVALWGYVLATSVRLWRRERGPDRVLAAGWTAGLCGYLLAVQFSFSVVATAPLVWLLSGVICGWEAHGGTGIA